jgi:hypothetical protein
MFNLIDYEWFGRVIVSVIEIAFFIGIGVLIMQKVIKAYYKIKKWYRDWWK